MKYIRIQWKLFYVSEKFQNYHKDEIYDVDDNATKIKSVNYKKLIKKKQKYNLHDHQDIQKEETNHHNQQYPS